MVKRNILGIIMTGVAALVMCVGSISVGFALADLRPVSASAEWNAIIGEQDRIDQVNQRVAELKQQIENGDLTIIEFDVNKIIEFTETTTYEEAKTAMMELLSGSNFRFDPMYDRYVAMFITIDELILEFEATDFNDLLSKQEQVAQSIENKASEVVVLENTLEERSANIEKLEQQIAKSQKNSDNTLVVALCIAIGFLGIGGALMVTMYVRANKKNI